MRLLNSKHSPIFSAMNQAGQRLSNASTIFSPKLHGYLSIDPRSSTGNKHLHVAMSLILRQLVVWICNNPGLIAAFYPPEGPRLGGLDFLFSQILGMFPDGLYIPQQTRNDNEILKNPDRCIQRYGSVNESILMLSTTDFTNIAQRSIL